MVGRSVSHYRILEKLGGDRMGVVCKVEDTAQSMIEELSAISHQRSAFSKPHDPATSELMAES